MPDTKFIWSQLFLRRKWGYSEDVNTMKKSLKRLNSSIVAELVRNRGGYIKYQDFKPIDELLFGRDGVNLSKKETATFLNTICAVIEKFSKTWLHVYPKLYLFCTKFIVYVGMWQGPTLRNYPLDLRASGGFTEYIQCMRSLPPCG